MLGPASSRGRYVYCSGNYLQSGEALWDQGGRRGREEVHAFLVPVLRYVLVHDCLRWIRS